MKKLIFATTGRLLVLGAAFTILGACSPDAGESDTHLQKTQAVQNFGSALESLNAAENLEKRSHESDLDLNNRRISLLAASARQLLRASGTPENSLNRLDDAQAVSQALKIYVTTKSARP